MTNCFIEHFQIICWPFKLPDPIDWQLKLVIIIGYRYRQQKKFVNISIFKILTMNYIFSPSVTFMPLNEAIYLKLWRNTSHIVLLKSIVIDLWIFWRLSIENFELLESIFLMILKNFIRIFHNLHLFYILFRAHTDSPFLIFFVVLVWMLYSVCMTYRSELAGVSIKTPLPLLLLSLLL